MDILIQLDGLLWRFGDVAPDAIAMLQDIRVISSQLRARNDERAVRVQTYLAPGDRNAPVGDKLARTEALLGLEQHGLQIVPAFDALQPASSDVILTSGDELYRKCRSEDLWAIRVGDHASDGEMVLPFQEIRRGLEERLRMPTARPMRAAVRKGGLLSVECASPGDAYELALDAIRSDGNADWVILDSTLVLYMEDADTDDRFDVLPNAERLSFGINKQALAFASEAAAPDSDGFLRVGAYRLFETDSSASGCGSGEYAPWSTVRRRRLRGRTRQPVSTGARSHFPPLILEQESGAQVSIRPAASQAARASAIWRAVTGVAAGNASADIAHGAEGPLAVTWTTDSERGASADISMWVYKGPFGTGRGAVSTVLQLSRWIGAVADRSHVLHCMLLSEQASTDMLQRTLFEDERNRVTSIVEFDGLADASAEMRIAAEPSTMFQPARIRIDGGGWARSPSDSEQILQLRALLADAVLVF